MKTGRVLFFIVLAMLAGMTAYEAAKDFFLPDLSLWQSHTITIVFSGAIAFLIGSIALGKYRQLLAFRDEAEQRLQVAHDVLEARVIARTNELSDSMQEAEMANRAKSELMANVSHELRTPLNAIIGFSSMMKDEMFGPLDGKYKEYAGDINEPGEHLLRLINDILDVAVIEAGKMELREETMNVAEVIDASLQMVHVRSDQGNIRLDKFVDDGLPALYADKRRVKQILLNLLSNAIKFTPLNGEVSITASLTPSGGHMIAIKDSGIGMNKTGVTKALSKFAQLDSGLDRKQDGTGLGLPLTLGLVESHGGQLHINSEEGKGTTVTVQFPPERTAQGQAAAL